MQLQGLIALSWKITIVIVKLLNNIFLGVDMKILAFGDTHGMPNALATIKKKAAHADLLICLGDFTFFGQHEEAILEEIADIGKPVLIIHGNHEDEHVLDGIEKRFPRLTNLHEKVVSIGNIRFIGYGGGGFGHHDSRFEKFARKVSSELSSGDVAVLVTHGPPHNTKLDHMYFLTDPHVGCKSKRAFIEKTSQIKLALSGHIHETFGAVDKIGETVLMNPGPRGKIIEIN